MAVWIEPSAPVTVMVAAGMTAPVVSATVPCRLPDCASAGNTAIAMKKTKVDHRVSVR